MIDPEVPISRENMEQAVEKMALACARGPVQHSTMLEIIELGYMPVGEKAIVLPMERRGQGRDGGGGRTLVRTYGTRGLSLSSWQGMEKRLRAAGFTVKRERHTHPDKSMHPDKIYLYWRPEA